MQDFVCKIGQKMRAWRLRKPTTAPSADKRRPSGLRTTRRDGFKETAESDTTARPILSRRSTASSTDGRLLDPSLLRSQIVMKSDAPVLQEDNTLGRDRRQMTTGSAQDLRWKTAKRVESKQPSVDDNDAKSPHSARQVQDSDTDAEIQDILGDKESIEWTPDMVQAVREANYVTFDGEDETDYTRGPARMIQAADGVVPCTALLLTLDLSKAIQKGIKAERDYFRAKTAANEQTEALLRFESTLNIQIASHRSRLTTPDLDETKKHSLERELANLELMLEEYKLERTSIENNLQFKGDQLRKLQSRVNAILEDAWVDAQLLEPDVEDQMPEVEEYDLQTEYHKFQQKLRSADEPPLAADSDEPLDTSEDHLHVDVEMTEEEEVNQAVWDTWDRLQAAQAEFDGRGEACEKAELARRNALKRGEEVEDTTTEIFDLRWLEHERGLTRALIDAEESYRAAQNAAEEASEDDLRPYEVSESDHSGGGDCSSSLDHSDHVASAPNARILRWLADLAGPAARTEGALIGLPVPVVVVDEWEAAELEVGDSISAIIDAEAAATRNPMRATIDQWAEAQRRMRMEFEASDVVL